MLSTPQFYAAFKRADFLVPCTWQPQGTPVPPAQTEYVRFGEPEQRAAGDVVIALDASIRYPDTVFQGLGDVRGDVVQIAGVNYRLLGRPERIADGTEFEARLKRADSVRAADA
jgi:hypothetical protein